MMPLGADFYRRKVAHIQARLEVEPVDGLLLLDTANVVYASGFVHSPSERPLGLYIPATGQPVLFIPLLEQENAAETWIGDIRTYFEYPGEEHPVLWMLRECGAARIGVDQTPLTSLAADQRRDRALATGGAYALCQRAGRDRPDRKSCFVCRLLPGICARSCRHDHPGWRYRTGYFERVHVRHIGKDAARRGCTIRQAWP